MPVFRCDKGLVLESISTMKASLTADKDTQEADYSASGVIVSFAGALRPANHKSCQIDISQTIINNYGYQFI